MFPLIPLLAGAAGGGLLGSLGSATIGAGADIYSAKMQAQANREQIAAQKEMADKQMTFQERMSSTAHQRDIIDLKAAGLNPILSAGGGGASSPPGAMPVLQNEMSGVGEKITSASQQIAQGLLNKSQIKTQNALQKANSAQAYKTQQEAYLTNQLTNKADFETDSARSQARINRMKADFWLSEIGTKLYSAQQGANVGKTITDSLGNFFPKLKLEGSIPKGKMGF